MKVKSLLARPQSKKPLEPGISGRVIRPRERDKWLFSRSDISRCVLYVGRCSSLRSASSSRRSPIPSLPAHAFPPVRSSAPRPFSCSAPLRCRLLKFTDLHFPKRPEGPLGPSSGHLVRQSFYERWDEFKSPVDRVCRNTMTCRRVIVKATVDGRSCIRRRAVSHRACENIPRLQSAKNKQAKSPIARSLT